MRKFSIKDWLSYKKARDVAYKAQYNLSMDRMKKVKSSFSTKIIKYKDCKKAYDYVDKLFPKAEVKKVTIYRVSQSCLNRIGLKGVGGCYDRISQIVVVAEDMDFSHSKKKDSTWSTIVAKAETDEVVVHELLHYVSMHNKGRVTSMHMEEEFAYGNSLAYLKANGRDDDDIINNNFLPYFMTAVDSRKIARKVLAKNGYDISEVATKTESERKKIFKKVDKELFGETKKQAIVRAKELMRIYSGNYIDAEDAVVDNSNDNEFSMIDFGEF